MTPSSDRDPAPQTPEDRPDDWTVHLDQDVQASVPAAEPIRLGRWLGTGLLVVLVAVAAVIWGPEVDTGEDPPPVAAVLGAHLAVPIALHLPADAITTADGSYVGVQFPTGGVVLVTVPTQVVDPSGVRSALPDDPAAWLAGHPEVFVSRLRSLTIGGAAATQLDYRRSRSTEATSRFARLPLFCGWRTEAAGARLDRDSTSATPQVCTQITADARVRATFVRVGERTVLLEAVWRVDPTGTGRMPRDLQRSYTAMLAGLTPVAT
jgi:hypothetical protein